MQKVLQTLPYRWINSGSDWFDFHFRRTQPSTNPNKNSLKFHRIKSDEMPTHPNWHSSNWSSSNCKHRMEFLSFGSQNILSNDARPSNFLVKQFLFLLLAANPKTLKWNPKRRKIIPFRSVTILPPNPPNRLAQQLCLKYPPSRNPLSSQSSLEPSFFGTTLFPSTHVCLLMFHFVPLVEAWCSRSCANIPPSRLASFLGAHVLLWILPRPVCQNQTLPISNWLMFATRQQSTDSRRVSFVYNSIDYRRNLISQKCCLSCRLLFGYNFSTFSDFLYLLEKVLNLDENYVVVQKLGNFPSIKHRHAKKELSCLL